MVKKSVSEKIEWLDSCAPEGDCCLDCDWIRHDITVYERFYNHYCMTYGLEIVGGKKCKMCADVHDLEELKHLRGK